MKRMLGFVALTMVICFVAAQTMVGQGPRDSVERRDKKGGSTVVSGRILEDSVAGVKIKPALGKDEVIPAGDIIRIGYGDFPIGVTTAMQKLSNDETNRNFPALLKGYEAIQALPELKTIGAPARRYIDFRVATLRAYAADGDEQLKAAAKGLADFMAAHADCWQFPQVARQLARLQADTGDYTGAAKTYEALRKTANVPNEFQQEATAALIDLAFQAEDYATGKTRVEEILKNPMSAPALKARAEMYQLGLSAATGDLSAAVKKIEDAINKAADASLKALGYNVLGDVYMAKKNNREAMWSYLMVDQIYNQDRGEHLKALTRLIKIFDAEGGDKDKAALFKEKLSRSR